MYPPIRAALKMLGLVDIGVYITHHQNTATQYIATCPIMELCLAVERNPPLQLSRRLWEQPALDILGIRVGNEALDLGEGTGGKGYLRER